MDFSHCKELLKSGSFHHCLAPLIRSVPIMGHDGPWRMGHDGPYWGRRSPAARPPSQASDPQRGAARAAERSRTPTPRRPRGDRCGCHGTQAGVKLPSHGRKAPLSRYISRSARQAPAALSPLRVGRRAVFAGQILGGDYIPCFL